MFQKQTSTEFPFQLPLMPTTIPCALGPVCLLLTKCKECLVNRYVEMFSRRGLQSLSLSMLCGTLIYTILCILQFWVSSESLLGFLGQTGLLPLPCEISYYSVFCLPKFSQLSNGNNARWYLIRLYESNKVLRM